MKKKYIASQMHLQSKHRHLLAYIIIKKQDQKISAELGPCMELNIGLTTRWLEPKLRMENLKIHSRVWKRPITNINKSCSVQGLSEAWTMCRNNIKHLDSVSDAYTPPCILQHTESICIWRNRSSEATPLVWPYHSHAWLLFAPSSADGQLLSASSNQYSKTAV